MQRKHKCMIVKAKYIYYIYYSKFVSSQTVISNFVAIVMHVSTICLRLSEHGLGINIEQI